MRIPYAVKGVVLLPAIVGLMSMLKAFCSNLDDSTCFADYFAVPIFLPLVAIYNIFGEEVVGVGNELLFVFSYWGAIGVLIGFILDLYTHRSPYSPEQHPLPSQTLAPVLLPQSPKPPF